MLKRPKAIPISPGIYTFRRSKTPLYIGKAANLRSRLASYFQKRSALPIKIQKMLAEATRLETIETASEVEALIREAELIKKYRPKYNLLMRDDKSYFYVGITKEPYPRIFVTHEPRGLRITNRTELRTTNTRYKQFRNSQNFVIRRKARYIGPFTSGTALKSALKSLRRVFPYCTCKQPHKRPCLNSEIGRCPGYCCALKMQSAKRKAKSENREYRKNIRSIVAVLSGERTRLVGRMKREMKDAVKKERYEEAARLRDAVFGLEDVFAHRQVLHAPGSTGLTTGEARYPWPIVLGKLQSLLKTKRDITRIEGYDISNISGTGATGSMVVFTNGQPDKDQYRKFRIRTVRGSNDVAMLQEVLRRRLNHPEWPYPELMVIDGGKGQLNAALSVLRTLATSNQMPTASSSRAKQGAGGWKREATIVTALAKREEILYTAAGRAIPLRRQDPAVLHLFQRIRDESHRFARAYHHKLRERLYAEANP